jgi:dihydrofolate reductase
MKNQRKVLLYIAMSLDGYIAGLDDSLDFLSTVEKEGEDYGYMDFVKTIDTVILGRKTYDKVLSMGIGFPHSDKDTYIITRTERPPVGKVRFYTGNLKKLITELKIQEGKNIYCDGGAEVVFMLLQDKLIDEIYISIIPIVLGEGIRLFKNGFSEQKLRHISTKNFDTGLVQLHYEFIQ